jgi:quercetin dioxygenase-like cupin family protein
MQKLSRVLRFLAFACIAAHPTGAQQVVPVHQEPLHRLVFESGPTRILDIRIPPGDTSLFHTHDAPNLYVSFSSPPTRSQVLGGEWSLPGTAAARAEPAPGGLSSATGYAEKPVTHRVTNVGDKLFHRIAVVNASAGSDAESADGSFIGAPALANRWFRAYRLTLAPGELTPTHRHASPVVLVQVSSGRTLGTGATKFELGEPGNWTYLPNGATHELRNPGDAPMEVVEVEVRLPSH